jgi:cyanophycinase
MSVRKGKFFLVGGGPVVRSLGETLMGHFINEAGGQAAKIAIITAGTNDPAEVNACYWEIFQSWGVKDLFSPKIFCREHAQSDWIYERIMECSGVFIAGGSQFKLSEKLAGTPVEKAFRDLLEKGGILAGTSSGASIFGNPMILDGGTVDRHLRTNMIEIGEGFGFLNNIAIDTHCASRGRLPRLISLLTEHPGILAIGIDEDTALLIDENNNAKVIGNNAVYFLDSANMRLAHSDNFALDKDHLCASEIIVHALTSGDIYDLSKHHKI